MRSGSIPYIDRFTVVRFQDDAQVRDAYSYFDNIRVTTDPAITPVQADLPAGGATTLQLVNVPGGDMTLQWQRNGTEIAGATNVTLQLSNVTTNQSGEYRAIVTIADARQHFSEPLVDSGRVARHRWRQPAQRMGDCQRIECQRFVRCPGRCGRGRVE